MSKKILSHSWRYNGVNTAVNSAFALAAINMLIFLAWGTGATQIITATVLSGVFLLFGFAGFVTRNSEIDRQSNDIRLGAERELDYVKDRESYQSKGGVRDIDVQTDRYDAVVQTDRYDVSRDASSQTDRSNLDFRTRTRMMRDQGIQARDVGVG